jgi:hypothetical protein
LSSHAIHNAQWGNLLMFCKDFEQKMTQWETNFDLDFSLISAIVLQTWHLKVKIIIIIYRIVCISYEKIFKICIKNASELCDHKRKFPNIASKCKWALWMRQQKINV